MTMTQTVRSDSPYSMLQQRLQYIARMPERAWTSIVENVPQADSRSLANLSFEAQHVMSYAPCNGYDQLIQAIIEREQRMYGIDPAYEHILITNGALHGLSLIAQAAYRPGAMALCQVPLLSCLVDTLADCGYTQAFFPVEGDDLDVDELRSRCTSQTRLIYLNSPHNPNGNVFSETTMRQLVRLAQERRIFIVMDLVYDSYVFEGAKALSPLSYTTNWEYIFTVNSVSKNFGAPGLRIGWLMSAEENIARLAGLLEQECIAVSGVAQHQAYQLLKRGNRFLVDRVKEGKRIIEEHLTSIPGIDYREPQGGTQYFVRLPVHDVEAFADYLLLEYGLVLTTSSNYAGVDDPCVRIPMGYPRETLQRALGLLADGLNTWSS